MGKHEVGTPKYISNKMKAKGLQKLCWYCEMCQKQCRDANGFKCHTMSESHYRQLHLFADNANKYMDQFSNDFSHAFLHLLKRQFGTKRVPANKVYQEYVADRKHVHMNATMWLTLTAYVKWLGQTGKCVVDETEAGWFITYKNSDPGAIAAPEKKKRKKKMHKNDDERRMEFVMKQVEKAKSSTDDTKEEFKQPFIRPEGDAPLVLQLKFKPKNQFLLPIKQTLQFKKLSQIDKQPKMKQEVLSDDKQSISSKSEHSSKRKRSEKTEEEPFNKKFKKGSDNKDERDKSIGWLREGLSVKIVTKSLGEKYYKAKGTVEELIDSAHFIGKIKLKSPKEVEGHIIKIDQEHLETVIPSIGREVMILWGKYNGEIALLEKVRIDDFCVGVVLRDRNRILKKIPYEQICKYVG